jgi:hypothetical protein
MQEITFDEAPFVARTDSIREAWSSVFVDPGLFLRHWNYKGAILSGGLRAGVFLVTYLISRESFRLALGAAFVQFVFRFFFAGLCGALIQSFRRVEPAWKALVSILLVIPVISHVLEFLVQSSFVYFTASADHTNQAIIRSICVSIFSVLFALFIMRRDVMIVGEAGSQSLLMDVTRFPRLIYDFIAFIPDEIGAMVRRGRYIFAALSLFGFGIFSQAVCWAVTNKPFWTYSKGKQIEGLRFWALDGVILMILAVTLSMVFSRWQLQRTSQATEPSVS